jgi:hypothetical protein
LAGAVREQGRAAVPRALRLLGLDRALALELRGFRDRGLLFLDRLRPTPDWAEGHGRRRHRGR